MALVAAVGIKLPMIEEALRLAGIDVLHPFSLRTYNDALPKAVGARIAAQGTAGADALCLLVCNSKAIWESFLSACNKPGSELLASADPLEQYIEQQVEAAVEQGAPGLQRRIFFSHRRTSDLEGGSEHVAFQRMAHATGLAYLDESCHLSIHPKFGTWLSLRACIVFDDVPCHCPAPRPLPNPLAADPATQRYVQMTMQAAVLSTSHRWQLEKADVEAAAAILMDSGNDEAPGSAGADASLANSSMVPSGNVAAVDGGEGNCQQEDATRKSSSSSGSEADPTERLSMHAVRESWRKWLAVRDAPCPGHFWRYSREMIEYHYTGKRSVLLAALKRRRMAPAPPSPSCLLMQQQLSNAAVET